MDVLQWPWFAFAGGLLAGACAGLAARLASFCTLNAIERWFYAGDLSGLRSWALAGLVALVLTQSMLIVGVVDLSQSFYLSPLLGLTGAIGGGLMFGYGMALVGTCGFGALVRLGGGSLKSLVALISITRKPVGRTMLPLSTAARSPRPRSTISQTRATTPSTITTAATMLKSLMMPRYRSMTCPPLAAARLPHG